MATFDVEVTDTFGGDANYSWVRRYTFVASSFLGAVRMLSRAYGKGWRKEIECGDYTQYRMRGAAITCFITIRE